MPDKGINLIHQGIALMVAEWGGGVKDLCHLSYLYQTGTTVPRAWALASE